MLFSICDVCRDVFKIGDKKFILAITEVIEENIKSGELQENFSERYQQIQNCKNKVKLFELCSNCKKVLEYVLKMRKTEVENILMDIEKSIEGEVK